MPQPRALPPSPLRHLLSPRFRSLPPKTRLSLAEDLLASHAAAYPSATADIYLNEHLVFVERRRDVRHFVDAIASSSLPRVVKASFLRKPTDLALRFLDFEARYCTSPEGKKFDSNKVEAFKNHLEAAHKISKAISPYALTVVAMAINRTGVHDVRHAFGAVRRGGHGHLIRLLDNVMLLSEDSR